RDAQPIDRGGCGECAARVAAARMRAERTLWRRMARPAACACEHRQLQCTSDRSRELEGLVEAALAQTLRVERYRHQRVDRSCIDVRRQQLAEYATGRPRTAELQLL